jgi:hypothetical protein
MLDEWPLDELPARASAIAGASAKLALTNNARRMRQFIDRLDIAPSVKDFRERSPTLLHMGCRRSGENTR